MIIFRGENEVVARALAILAREAGMDERSCIDGERYYPTPLGWVRVEQYNLFIENHELREKLEDLGYIVKALKQKVKQSYLERALDVKAEIKIIRILEQNIPAEEKVKQIKRYLNV